MTALSETAVGTYRRLADLPLVIESYSFEGLNRAWSSEFTRRTTVKPSRFGTLETLLEALDHLESEGIGAYGGGQFELGPGRGQIQHLAALFHPDAPNDVAPLGYPEVEVGLPHSPLLVPTDTDGFR